MSKDERNEIPDLDLDLDLNLDDITPEVDSPEDSITPEDTPEEEHQPEYGEEADPNIIAAYNFYRDKGLLSVEDEFDGTMESLQTLLSKEDELRSNTIFDQFVSSTPDWAQPLVEIILNKGPEATLEDFQTLLEVSRPSEISLQDLDDDTKAESYLKNYYMNVLGDSEEEALEKVDMDKDRNKVAEKAKKAFEKSEEIRTKVVGEALENSRGQKQRRQQDEQLYLGTFQNSVAQTKWRDDLKETVQNEFMTGNFKQRLEHLLQNPTVLPDLVAFVSYYDGKQIDKENFRKQAFSATTKQVKDNVKNYWSGNKSVTVKESNNNSNNKDLLERFELEL